jgi:hypothetical protein
MRSRRSLSGISERSNGSFCDGEPYQSG